MKRIDVRYLNIILLWFDCDCVKQPHSISTVESLFTDLDLYHKHRHCTNVKLWAANRVNNSQSMNWGGVGVFNIRYWLQCRILQDIFSKRNRKRGLVLAKWFMALFYENINWPWEFWKHQEMKILRLRFIPLPVPLLYTLYITFERFWCAFKSFSITQIQKLKIS